MRKSPKSRHSTAKRFIIAAGIVLLLACGIDGVLIEPQSVVVRHIDIVLPHLPREFDGLKIVQMSDFHQHFPFSDRPIRKAVRLANAQHADVIVLTGDYITNSMSDIPPCARLLAPLQAREGVFAVLGNHDGWDGAPSMSRALRQESFHVLNNDAAGITRKGKTLWLAGVEDALVSHADLDAAMRKIPRGSPTPLLVHEPDYADIAARYPIDLQLSGHSHGGQIRLPFLGALHYPPYGRKYPEGLQRVGAMQVYTTRGVGTTGPPVRFFCRPEIAVITLHAQ